MNLTYPMQPELTLSLSTVSSHLFFWEDSQILDFINEFSNYMETHLDDEKVKKFELASQILKRFHYPGRMNYLKTFSMISLILGNTTLLPLGT